jgi:phospholipase C
MTIRCVASLRTIGLALLLSSCSSSDTDKAVPVVSASPTPGASPSPTALSEQNMLPTATPIKHLVVIFGENQSFDHYFGTYPRASNPSGEPAFTAAVDTPFVNGYLGNTTLLTNNPNTTSEANLKTGIAPSLMNPFRLDRAQFDTASQNHGYTAEQRPDGLLRRVHRAR